jgi:hypothetical protein
MMVPDPKRLQNKNPITSDRSSAGLDYHPSTKSDQSQRKIRIFLKLTSDQAAYIAPTFLPRRRSSRLRFLLATDLRKRRDRMTDGVIRKFATDVDEPVLVEPRKAFFVRFMEALRETRRRQADREIAKHAHLLSNDSWQQLDLWRSGV